MLLLCCNKKKSCYGAIFLGAKKAIFGNMDREPLRVYYDCNGSLAHKQELHFFYCLTLCNLLKNKSTAP